MPLLEGHTGSSPGMGTLPSHPRRKATRPVTREVIEKLIDDLDGTDAAETLRFGLDGTSYEIDLSAKNAAAFRKAVDRYVKAARRQSSGARPSRSPGRPKRSTRRPK